MSTEVLVLHVGQGGIQLGNSIWELLCIEHGISPDGETMLEDSDIMMKTFFQEVVNERFCPRCLFVDSEPTVVDEIRSGVYKNLYHPDQIINGMEDAASNFARGSFVTGTGILKVFSKRLHKLTEEIDNLESFLIFNSVSGGSGSGIGSLLLQQIALEFPKVTRIQMPIFCGPSMSTAIVEPYNTIFHGHTTMDTVDLSILFDNEALYEIIQTLLLVNSSTYSEMNRLVSLMVSSITCSVRYQSVSHTSLREISTNLIPYPRIHFAMVRHAPIEHKSRVPYSNFTVDEITKNVFSKTYQTLKCNTNRGRFISIILNYRGFVSPREITESIQKYKASAINFVEWCPTGFKLGINALCPIVVPDSPFAPSDKGVTMLCNSTSIKELWMRMGRKFDLLFDKRAFVHWFITEGMEESEFDESRLNIIMLEEDFEEISLSEDEILDQIDTNSKKEFNSDVFERGFSHDADID